MSKHIVSNIVLICVVLLDPYSAMAQTSPPLDVPSADADFTILGAAAWDKAGYFFAPGDFNGDGIPDLAVMSQELVSSSGYLFLNIVWGGSLSDSTLDLRTNGDITSYIYGIRGEMGVYSSLTAGDFNNDGFDDIVIGIPCIYPFLNCAGRAHVIFGTPSFPDTLYLENPIINVTTIYGVPGSNGWLGNTMTVGDINGDTYDDIVISAHDYPGGGQVYIILGRDAFPSNIYLGTNQPNMVRIIRSDPHGALGTGLATGDINNDGIEDLLLGIPTNAAGKAILLFGGPALPDTIDLSNPSVDRITIYGGDSPDLMGWRVAIADINNDDHQDLILSAPFSDPLGCSDCGEIYIIYGSDSLPDSLDVRSSQLSITHLIGAGVRQDFGTELVCADLDNDQYSDIIVTSIPDGINQADVGKVTILYGSSELADSIFLGTDSTLTRFYAEQRSDEFGMGLSIVDFNDDEINDLVIGAYRADPKGRTDAGIAYIFFGSGDTTGTPHIQQPVFALFQNYPNPFSSGTTIGYSLDKSAASTLTIYNVLGQRVDRISAPRAIAGPNIFTWNGLDERGNPVASGLYLYRVESRGYSQTKKMVLVR